MKTWWWIGGVVGLVAVGAFAWWTISPLFRTVRLDEALPQANTQSQATTTTEQGQQDQQPVGATGGQPVVLAFGSVEGTLGHPASGQASLVQVDDTFYIRYQDFKTIDGPDIFVYLSKDKDAREFVNLGKVKATEGNVNYQVPAGVDVAQYKYVLVWCKAFGVLFNSAELVATE